MEGSETAAVTPALKRKRGRPKGSLKARTDGQPPSSNAPAAPTAPHLDTSGAPAKRGRGRPRKVVDSIPKFDLPKHLLTSTGAPPTVTGATPAKKKGRPSKANQASVVANGANVQGSSRPYDESAIEAASIQAAISQGAFANPHFFGQAPQHPHQALGPGYQTPPPRIVEKIVVKEVKVPVEKIVYRDRPPVASPVALKGVDAETKAKLLAKFDQLRTFGNGLESEEMQEEFDGLLQDAVKLVDGS